jgi:N-acetylneuraminic acid mutarotase
MDIQIEQINELFDRYYYDFMAIADYHWKMERSITNLLEDEKKRWNSMKKIRIMCQQEESWKLLDFSQQLSGSHT